MAPTEVLAVQHFETISGYVEKYGIAFRPVLLTGSMTAKEKREAYAKIASGEANLIIGTHALIQEKVEYSSLALVRSPGTGILSPGKRISAAVRIAKNTHAFPQGSCQFTALPGKPGGTAGSKESYRIRRILFFFTGSSEK